MTDGPAYFCLQNIPEFLFSEKLAVCPAGALAKVGRTSGLLRSSKMTDGPAYYFCLENIPEFLFSEKLAVWRTENAGLDVHWTRVLHPQFACLLPSVC